MSQYRKRVASPEERVSWFKRIPRSVVIPVYLLSGERKYQCKLQAVEERPNHLMTRMRFKHRLLRYPHIPESGDFVDREDS